MNHVIRSISALQDIVQQPEQSIHFVPTMGGLHRGHLGLVEAAQEKNSTTIVSIFVNPTQFAAGEDLDAYPKDFESDRKKIHTTNPDAIVYLPQAEEIYNTKNYTWVVPDEKINSLACGTTRPTHFRGVLTVLLKFFNIIKPHKVFMGKKDYQQLFLVKKMAQSFFLNTEIIGVPTYRNESGLALSSRNTYLTQEELKIAPSLFNALQNIKLMWHSGSNITNIAAEFKKMIHAKFKLDYLEFVDADSFTTITDKVSSDGVALCAAYLGKTRLIDNIELSLTKEFH